VPLRTNRTDPATPPAALCSRRLTLANGLIHRGLASKGERWFFLLSLATLPHSPRFHFNFGGNSMNSIVYIVGLVVIIGAILAFFGLR
jgi:hypothetical protein